MNFNNGVLIQLNFNIYYNFNTKMNEAFGFLTVSHPDRHQMPPKTHSQPMRLVNTGHIQVGLSSD